MDLQNSLKGVRQMFSEIR